MKFEIEIERNNVTPAQFLAYCRRRVDAKGGEMLRGDLDLNYFKAGNDLNFDIDHRGANDDVYQMSGCIREKSISEPYRMQTFISWKNGAKYNEICEFEYDDEKTGHGYYYLCNIDAEQEAEEPESADTKEANPEEGTKKEKENKMKSATYINKIVHENACSIQTTEKLTEALHREGILHPDLALRFRPLFGDFDIVHKEWLKCHYNIRMSDWYMNPIEDPRKIPEYAETVTMLYNNAKAYNRI